MSSRAKGVRFERRVAKLFEQAGYAVRGLESGGDHFCVDTSGVVLHVEAKDHKILRLPDWLRQQRRDCPAGLSGVLVFNVAGLGVYVCEPFEQRFKGTE